MPKTNKKTIKANAQSEKMYVLMGKILIKKYKN